MTLAERLEAWEPAPLRHPLARAAAIIWAAPISAAGLVVGAVSGAPARVRDGVLLFAPIRGLPGKVLRSRGYAASALGHVVLSVPADPPPQLLAHELVHTRQAERLGVFMAPVYLLLLLRYGYRGHPLERAAYRIASRTTSAA